jgi:hypothetical protein
MCTSEVDIPSETAGDLSYCLNGEAYNAKILVALVCAEGSSYECFIQTVTTAILTDKRKPDCPAGCTETRRKGSKLQKSAINYVDIA